PRSTKETTDFVASLREEYRALGRVQSLIGWYVDTQGETAITRLTYIGHDRLFRKAALDAVAAAQAQPGVADGERLALQLFRRALTAEVVSLSVAPFDDEFADAEATLTVTLPWKEKPVSYRDMSILIAQEPDAERRKLAFTAMNAV